MKNFNKAFLSHLTVRSVIWLFAVILYFPVFTVLLGLTVLSLLHYLGLFTISPEFLSLSVSDFVTGCLAYSAAVSVALIALFGVWLQSKNAARMHRLDKKIELKKEIFLEFASASAKQNEALLNLGNATADMEETNERLQGVNRAWHQLCLIASNETIEATSALNSKWGPAYIEVSRFRMSNSPVSATRLLKFAIKKQCELMPYMAAAYAQMRRELDNPDSGQDLDIEVYKGILSKTVNEMKEYFDAAFPD